MKSFKARWSGTASALLLGALGVAMLPVIAAAKPDAKDNAPPGAQPAAEQPKAAPEGPRPIAKCELSVHNFGETWMGPTLTHAFVVKNEGDAPLEIIKVKPACGCTAAGEHPKTIAPGQSGEFPFSLNSTKLRGAYDKAITITTNDPVNPDLRLKLTGNCKRYVDILPTHAIFGKITDDEAQERVLKITNNTEKDIEVTVDPATDGPFKFDLVAVKPGKEFELKVSLQQPFKPGDYRNGTTIKTNVAEQATISVIATATVPERLEVLPETVTLNPITTADKPYVRPLRFTNYGKKPVKVVEAISDDPVLKVTVNERTEGKAYTINVDVPAGYVKPTKENQKIVLKTDDPDRPTIDIPVIPLPTSPDAPPAIAEAGKEAAPQRPAEALVGKPAPVFSLTTVDGKPLSNDTLKDAITVLDFWAPNCGFCKKQLPMLENVRKEFADKGVRFVAVNQTMRQQFELDKVKEVLGGTGFTGELAIDSGNTVGNAFAANSYPTLVVLGKSGKVEAVTPGAVPDFESRLKGQLESLIAGKPLPVPPPAPTPAPKANPQDALVGKPAPNFEPFKTVDGKPFDTASFKDKITVVNFWAQNCGFCKKQMPRVETVRKEYEAKGVRFVAVSQTMRQDMGEEKIKETLKETGFNAELVIDKDNKIGPNYGASGFPTMAIIGKTGNIEAINVGNIGDLETKLKAQLDALIEGKPLPKTETAAAPPQQRPAETMIGQAAPTFSIKTMKGDVVDNAMLAKHAGTVLTFTAPNCGFCKKVAPTVEKVRTEYEGKNIRFVNMVQSMRKDYTPEEAQQIFKDAGYNADIAHDPKNEIGGMFKASGFPTTVVVGKDGKIANVFVGAKPDLETTLKAQLDGLITAAGK